MTNSVAEMRLNHKEPASESGRYKTFGYKT
jgi:hypothetical protein